MPGKKGRSGRRSRTSFYEAPGERKSLITGEPTMQSLSFDELCSFRQQLMVHTEQIPDDLYLKMTGLVDSLIRQRQWTWQQIHMARWMAVRLSRNSDNKMVDDSVFKAATKHHLVADTPARGGSAAMKESYWWMEDRWRQVV